MPKLAKYKECTGCLACVDTCNHRAIYVKKVHELLYPAVDSDKCVDCKLCEMACPVVTPVGVNNVEDMRVYGGWSKNEDIRVASASGGACTALSVGYMKQYADNAVVYGVTLENNRAHHKRTESIEDLKSLMNSKYIQSNTEGIFKQVKSNLKDGKYLMFTGTPCQIAGLYGFLGKKAQDEHLMTIELICAGVMSPEALDIHLEAFKSPRILSFRNKEEGQKYSTSQCTTIERDGKPFRFEKRREDVFYQCFSSSILERQSCHDCKFARLTRVADITIGDFWGGNKDFKEYEKGVNVVIANNPRAVEFVKNCPEIEVYGSTIGKAISGNPCLYDGYKFIKFHPMVMWSELCRKVLPRKVWLDIVTNKNPWRYLWACYRLLSKLNIKRKNKLIIKKYSHLINEWWGG